MNRKSTKQKIDQQLKANFRWFTTLHYWEPFFVERKERKKMHFKWSGTKEMRHRITIIFIFYYRNCLLYCVNGMIKKIPTVFSFFISIFSFSSFLLFRLPKNSKERHEVKQIETGTKKEKCLKEKVIRMMMIFVVMCQLLAIHCLLQHKMLKIAQTKIVFWLFV